MSVIFIALPAAVLIAACAVVAFAWAVKRGQYDDLDTPPLRAVFDDEGTPSRREDRTVRGADAASPAGDLAAEHLQS